MTVGERMKGRRKQIGMSAEEVAIQLGLSPSTIYRYENGDIEKMGIDKLEPIASALHTTPAYLMGWTDDWYDYDTDEDNRFCEIPIAQFEALMEHYDDDLESVWHAWEQIQDDIQREHYSIPSTSESEHEIKNPDIRMIARAGRKMTPEQAENLRKYAEYMFPEAFADDG